MRNARRHFVGLMGDFVDIGGDFPGRGILQSNGLRDQRRDFIHVRDVVAANIAALESSVRGEVFNVGSGTSLSVKELADMISPDQVHSEGRKGDSAATLADISKIQAALGWSPKISFADGLKALIK